MRTRHNLAFGLLLISLVVATFYFVLPPPPRYAGHSLSYWLKELDDGDRDTSLLWSPWNRPDSHPGPSEAADAMRAIGTNAFPYLLAALTNRDSAFKISIIARLKQQSFFKIPIRVAADYQRPAGLALHALGPACKPLIPQLTAALGQNGSEKAAAIALAGIGPEGWTALTEKCTGSNSSWGTVCAIWALGNHQATVPGTITVLMTQVTNNNGNGAIAAWALGEIHGDGEAVIPVLILGLQSAKNDVRFASAEALGKFGTNAQSALPQLLIALHDSDISVTNNAAAAIKKIDPARAKNKGK